MHSHLDALHRQPLVRDSSTASARVSDTLCQALVRTTAPRGPHRRAAELRQRLPPVVDESAANTLTQPQAGAVSNVRPSAARAAARVAQTWTHLRQLAQLVADDVARQCRRRRRRRAVGHGDTAGWRSLHASADGRCTDQTDPALRPGSGLRRPASEPALRIAAFFAPVCTPSALLLPGGRRHAARSGRALGAPAAARALGRATHDACRGSGCATLDARCTSRRAKLATDALAALLGHQTRSTT